MTPAPWVVVVDDEPDILESVIQLLRASMPDITAIGTLSPAEALKMVDQGIDLMVTDFRMPTMDGLQLARAARRLDDGLAVILFTAYADDAELMHQALKAGVQTVIPKPLDPDSFVKLIAKELRA